MRLLRQRNLTLTTGSSLPLPIHVYLPGGEAFRPTFAPAFPDRPICFLDSPQSFEAEIESIVYLLALQPPRGLWSRASRLRLIQAIGAGVDSILPATDIPPHVHITNNRGLSAVPMAEFALSLVLGLAKRLPSFLQAQRAREWRRAAAPRLDTKTLGILGLGAIGQALAERARLLGMRVIGTRRGGQPHPSADEIVDGETLLATSDIVVVLLPYTDETRNYLSATRLALLRPGAHLINLARGGILDEAALAAMLRERRLASAALDVFDQEPLPADHGLWDVPNLWITPHVAGAFPGLLPEAAKRFADNVARIERGHPPHNLVDREAGY